MAPRRCPPAKPLIVQPTILLDTILPWHSQAKTAKLMASAVLAGHASMEAEAEGMEWKGAVVMLAAWQRALQEGLHQVRAAGH